MGPSRDSVCTAGAIHLGRVIRVRGQGHEMRPFLFPQRQRWSLRRVVRPRIDLRQPRLGDKRVQVRERGERAGVEEMGGDMGEGFFDLSLRLRAARSTGPWSVAVVEREGEEPRVIDRLLAVPLLDDDFHIVVEARGGGAAQMVKGPHVLAERRGEILRLDEPEVPSSRVAEDVTERVHAPAPFLRERDLKGRIIHLRLHPRSGLEAHDRLARGLWSHGAQAILHDRVPAGETLGPQLLIEPYGGDVGIPLEQGGDVIGIGVDGTAGAPSAARCVRARRCGRRRRPFSDPRPPRAQWRGTTRRRGTVARSPTVRVRS